MLVALLLRQSGRAPGQRDVAIPMTRSDMANYLGLSLEPVVRAPAGSKARGLSTSSAAIRPGSSIARGSTRSWRTFDPDQAGLDGPFPTIPPQT